VTLAATDLRWMRRALRLAARARGATHPNPMGGAVVLDGAGQVVGEGYHHRAGQPHAEALALAAAGPRAAGGTLYVTLEPCNHHGRTPPCSEAILASGVARVVVGSPDPNPTVAGGGLLRLRQAGLAVDLGVHAEACRRLNEDWLVRVTRGRPHVTVKAAVTLDGWLASSTGDSRWISGERSRREVHRRRALADGVLVGAGTLLHDDPRLTARLPRARQPRRCALDPELRCAPTANLLRPGGGPVILFAGPEAPRSRQQVLEAAGAEIVRVPRTAQGRLDLHRVLAELAARDLVSVLVEGGGELIRELLELALVDRLLLFVAPRLLGGRDGVPLAGRLPGAPTIAERWTLTEVTHRRCGDDLLVSGVPRRGPAAAGEG